MVGFVIAVKGKPLRNNKNLMHCFSRPRKEHSVGSEDNFEQLLSAV